MAVIHRLPMAYSVRWVGRRGIFPIMFGARLLRASGQMRDEIESSEVPLAPCHFLAANRFLD